MLVEDTSGGEAYYYGRQGEVVKTVRTVMASLATYAPTSTAPPTTAGTVCAP